GGWEIRILFAIAHLGKGGGVALQAFQLFKILQRTVDVQLVCLDAPGPHRGLTQEPGVMVAGPLVFPRGIQTLAQALRSSRRDHRKFERLPTAEEARRLRGLPTDRTLLSYVGKVIPEKRLEWLLDVVRRLPDTDAVVVGGYTEEHYGDRYYRQLLATYGEVGARTHFIGEVPWDHVPS